MKTKVVSVRLKSLVKISDKAYKAIAFDGSEDILPISQVFGEDYSVSKSEAYWIAEWLMKKKSLQYSHKKTAWFNSKTNRLEPNITVEKHVPKPIEPIERDIDANLVR